MNPRFFNADQMVACARHAPKYSKSEFIRRMVGGKSVLDLGAVGHSADRAIHTPETWLHGLLRAHAREVVGVDLLEEEVSRLRALGIDIQTGDACRLKLGRTFDVVVCGDLLEHVSEPQALLQSISDHLNTSGIALITTPNPLAATRFFNLLLDGTTPINHEHVSWYCPQTAFQLVERSPLYISELAWLATDYPCDTRHRRLGSLANVASRSIARHNHLLETDFGMVLRPLPQDRATVATDRPYISAVLPTYRRPDMLADALRSLCRQDYPATGYEILVVDNDPEGSARRTVAETLRSRSHHPRVAYIIEPRPGLVFSRHSGAVHARSDVLFFGDDDAVFSENCLSIIGAFFSAHPEAGAVGTKIEVEWDGEPEPWVRKFESLCGRSDLGVESLVRIGLNINGGSFGIRRNVLRIVGGFHPGQRGEYITGDSETGLCDELALRHIPVGWTGATTTRHRQVASVHASLDGMKRRFANWGISRAYKATYDPGGMLHRLRGTYSDLKQVGRAQVRALRNHDRTSLIHARLQLEFLRFNVLFQWKYRFEQELASLVSDRSWVLDSAYQAPAVALEISERVAPIKRRPGAPGPGRG